MGEVHQDVSTIRTSTGFEASSDPNAVSAAVSAATSFRTQPLITTRIGILFFVAACCALACGAASGTFPDDRSFSSVMWIATVAVCSLCGLFSIRSVRTLRTIESELRRSGGRPQTWRQVRPLIGEDPITEAWNELLREATVSHEPSETRTLATLDQEAITLARAMRGLPTAWVITDLDGRMLFISAPACGLFGLSDQANHGGRDLLDLLNLRAGDDSVHTKRNRLLSNIRMIHERHQVILGGERVHLRISRSRLDGRVGDGEGLAWILSDVTQQELATKSRDQFLMTATHELRTPLNNLQAYAEALAAEEQLEIERQKEFCNVIVSESHRLGRLVDQLLTVGQMEAGSMVSNRHELEILPMVEYATDQMRAQAEQKRQRLLCELSPKLPTVLGDRDKLQAALVNLIGNAVKYTPENGEIHVRAEVQDGCIRIDVQDNGLGIEPDEQEKVFEKFYRGTNAENSHMRGNGLGLAFTREVVRMHGGDIELQSTIGEGSMFTMRLPIGGQSRSGI
ncbi:PAS domain-containing sensor histidine kinase [Stieleria sp. JC731]|uniref:PAS domain-containing sensor histidine kinase n=1 Tax=Pirellulaceae TaxID=2691357 RepID=UPI001E33671D|nr:PAS domain-containing sensor histidine kinase [Stieleria sp. JC731]MCC9601499.1 PAS domain-containing sensor histidine kinase [Stieleria sp. JC731]